MKIKLYIFQNGKHQIFLPRTIEADQLADVAFNVAKKFDTQKRLKNINRREEMVEVESEHYWGFVLNGHHYEFGEIYRRVK